MVLIAEAPFGQLIEKIGLLLIPVSGHSKLLGHTRLSRISKLARQDDPRNFFLQNLNIQIDG